MLEVGHLLQGLAQDSLWGSGRPAQVTTRASTVELSVQVPHASTSQLRLGAGVSATGYVLAQPTVKAGTGMLLDPCCYS